MSKKLVIYDFDGTLFCSLDEVEGKRLYKEKTGLLCHNFLIIICSTFEELYFYYRFPT